MSIYILIILLLLIAFMKANHKKIEVLCDNLYKPCAKALLREASSNNIIVLSVVSNKFIIQIKNYWITSAIPNKFTNILFLATDTIAYSYCRSFTKYVMMGNVVINQTEELIFMNKDYLKIVFSRIQMINTILLYGFSVIITDLDIYLFKNPISYVTKYNDDIVISVDNPSNVNVGF